MNDNRRNGENFIYTRETIFTEKLFFKLFKTLFHRLYSAARF